MGCRGLMYSLLAMLCLAVAVEATAQEVERERADFELGRATEILANIMREFEVGFVDEVKVDDLLNSAVMGMVMSTDPYSEYLSEEDMNDFEVLTTGRYGGVGSTIRQRGDYVIFAQPYQGSPSDKAGIRIGDKIVSIDGYDMKGATVKDASDRLKGEPETFVEVVIKRNIGGTIDTLRLCRERISIPSIPYSGIIRDGVGYISHNDFIEGSYDEMRRAVERLMATDSLKGIVLDYRSNGGGVMQEAVDILSLFLPRNERVVSVKGRDSSSLHTYSTRYAPLAEDVPIVVLVSDLSASSSEILAGALQDLDRAVIMGQRTYGKGLVQGTRYLGYNSYLKYTTSKYYIPSGRCIQSRDYSDLRNRGGIKSIPDSLISEYATRNGRRVWDGGGIVPDVKLEPEYVSRFATTLYQLGFMDDWADEYMQRHHEERVDPRTFVISDQEYEDFCRFLQDKDVPYESGTRTALVALEKAMKNDLYTEELGVMVESLKASLKDDTASNLERYRDEIIETLSIQIILRNGYLCDVEERVAVKDEAVDRAIELLLDSEEYNRILREQHLEKH